jgi:hypothetical protein
MAEYDCTTQGAISLAAFTKLMRPTLRATRRLDMRELLVSPATTSTTTAAAAVATAVAELSNSSRNSSAHSSGTSKALPTATAAAAASGSGMLSSRGSFRGGSSAVYSTGGSGSQRVRRLSYRGVPIGVSSSSGSASGTLEELSGSGHSRRRLSGTAVSNPSVSFASIRLSAMSGNLARLAAEVSHCLLECVWHPSEVYV